MKVISKKALSFVLTLAMVTGMLTGIPFFGSVTAYADSQPLKASAAIAYYDGSKLYKDSGCTEEVTDKTTITKAVIKENVTSIGNFAFSGCTNLTDITIPESVESIGEYAFQLCKSLTKIEIPSKVSIIKYHAFYLCHDLSSVTISGDINDIDSQAFIISDKLNNLYVVGDKLPQKFPLLKNTFLFKENSGHYEMTKYYGNKTDIEIPTTLYGKPIDPPIDKSKLEAEKITAYYNGTGLYKDNACLDKLEWNNYLRLFITNVEFVGNVTSIGKSAFESCTSLENITIPESVTAIGAVAFYNCTSLKDIRISSKVTSIGEYSFNDCTSLSKISVDPQNPNYASEDGVLFTKDKETLICFPGGKIGAYAIPEHVTSIKKFAFSDCIYLTDVTIPTGITSIPNFTFSNCVRLKSVKIPGSMETIENVAFGGCSSLNSIEIPAKVTAIGSSAFSSCTGLDAVVIRGKITSIGNYAFAKSINGASSLTFYVPKNLVSHYTGLLNSNVMCQTTATVKALENVTEFEAVHKDATVPNGTPLANLNLPDSLQATVDGTKQTISGVTWVPDRPYEPITAGKYVFTAVLPLPYSMDSGVELPKITITVALAPPNTYTVSVQNTAGGSITASPLTAKQGDTITLTVTPNTGKQLVSGSIKYSFGGKEYPVTQNGFAMPSANVTVTAQFENKSSNSDSNHHHRDDTPRKPDTTSPQSIIINAPTNTSADLTGTIMPAGVTSVSLSVSQRTSSDTSDPQAVNAFHVLVANNSLHIIGTPFLYNIKLLDQSGNNITGFTGKVKVKLPIPQGLNGTPHVFRFEEDTKTFTDMNAVVENGFLVFETDHFSYYAVAGTGCSLTLDTTNYTMPVGGTYHIGMKLVNTQGVTVKVTSSNSSTATVTQFANGVCRVNGKEAGNAYILYDVYNSKKQKIASLKVKINVVKGSKPFGSSARQIAVF